MRGDLREGVRQFYSPPDRMDSWAVRVLTVAIVFQLLSSVMLFQNLWDTQHQLERGRAERNTQVCLLIRDQIKDARAIMEAGC